MYQNTIPSTAHDGVLKVAAETETLPQSTAVLISGDDRKTDDEGFRAHGSTLAQGLERHTPFAALNGHRVVERSLLSGVAPFLPTTDHALAAILDISLPHRLVLALRFNIHGGGLSACRDSRTGGKTLPPKAQFFEIQRNFSYFQLRCTCCRLTTQDRFRSVTIPEAVKNSTPKSTVAPIRAIPNE